MKKRIPRKLKKKRKLKITFTKKVSKSELKHIDKLFKSYNLALTYDT